MSLAIVATSIGNAEDITLRAIRCLREADLVIGEERKEVALLLKSLELQKPIELLNEHSKAVDFEFLTSECATKNVVLVSDCGTPGFCDPGSELVSRCRARGIAITPVPGASSLMSLIAVAGLRLQQFLFVGFLPAKQELRGPALQALKREARGVVLMDTPYRLERLLSELAQLMPTRVATLGLDLTQSSEQILETSLQKLAPQVVGQKREFIILLHPSETEHGRIS